jgi:RHS repeat-associated protein
LQDLNYEYDATGNLIQQTDNAQTTQYFGNQQIAPVSTYEYDALYRLTKATGRELANLAAPTHNDFPNNIPCPAIVPANLIRRYMHYYQYDAMGNMLQMQNAGNWTRNYIYDTLTNRLLKHDLLQSSNDYTYDEHGNITSMPHLSLMSWDEKDQLISASNGTFTSYYNYDNQGNRTRKVVDKGNIIETRYYIGGYEAYRKEVNQTLTLERETLNIADDEKVFVRIEQKTGENEIVRYQYDNHLGSACLELDGVGQIISYEEYHPFGTTSYRAGRSETEVSLKKYKYCGKERDEETGLYYYGMRYYAAWLCRFVSTDPLQFDYPELTPFQYASNRPITMIDLDGCEAVEPKGFRFLLQKNTTSELGPYIKPSTKKEDKKVSYKKEVVDGKMKSDDITQDRIQVIEQGKLDEIKGVVLHRTAGSTTSSVLSAFKTGVEKNDKQQYYGTHFVVGKDGKILQTAHLDKKTWHVGKPTGDITNSNSIGIEVVGSYDKATKTWEELTPEQTTAVANLVNYLMETFGLNPNTDLYVHENVSKKTAGEGQVVHDAIKDLLVTPESQSDSQQNVRKEKCIMY